MIIAITGHRPERLRGHEEEVREWINKRFNWWDQEYFYGDGKPVDYAISGMAQGVDQIFAKEALNRGIKLWCYYPFEKSYFHDEERRIMNRANDVIFVCGSYSKSSYIIRDKKMVDDCDILLAVWDGIEQGGTWATIKYAKEKNKTIIFFPWNPDWNN